MRIAKFLLTALLVASCAAGCQNSRQSRDYYSPDGGGEVIGSTPHFGDMPSQPMPSAPGPVMGEPALALPKGA